MTIDKYTKFILTLIAVGILGLNFHLFNGGVVKDAYASSGNDYQVVVTDRLVTPLIFKNGGSQVCLMEAKTLGELMHNQAQWLPSNC